MPARGPAKGPPAQSERVRRGATAVHARSARPSATGDPLAPTARRAVRRSGGRRRLAARDADGRLSRDVPHTDEPTELTAHAAMSSMVGSNGNAPMRTGGCVTVGVSNKSNSFHDECRRRPHPCNHSRAATYCAPVTSRPLLTLMRLRGSISSSVISRPEPRDHASSSAATHADTRSLCCAMASASSSAAGAASTTSWPCAASKSAISRMARATSGCASSPSMAPRRRTPNAEPRRRGPERRRQR